MESALKETLQRQVVGLELLSGVHLGTKLYWQVKDQCQKREHKIYQKFWDRPFLFRILNCVWRTWSNPPKRDCRCVKSSCEHE